MTVTNYMLKKKWAELNKELQLVHRASTNTTALDEEGTVSLYTDIIEKVHGDTVINSRKAKAKLFNPMPCLHWKCINTPDKDGVMTLKNKLEGLFIDNGDNVYCLGVTGVSDEFEVRLQVGTDEIRMNNLFLNVNTSHLVINGEEEKRE